MKPVKWTVVLIVLLLWAEPPVALQAQQNDSDDRSSRTSGVVIEGVVIDERDGAMLEGAHLYPVSGNGGTVSDPDGGFSLVVPDLPAELTVSHLGYQSRSIRIESREEAQSLEITLAPIYLPLDGELRVTSNRRPAYHTGVYADVRTRAVEDHLRTMTGFDLVSRANVAREPVIRGLRGSRVDVKIDGMRMTPACVDGMDPLTAYLESDNLESIDVSRGHLSGGTGRSGGSVDFRMARPQTESGLNARVESGYQHASAEQVHQAMISTGQDRWAIRLSGTYRNAGDMRAGGDERIRGTSYEKGNIYTAAKYKASDNHNLSLRYVGDFAGKMGYPALMMDTRRADAHLLGLEHDWSSPLPNVARIRTSVYSSRVEHRMDDYDRDVTSRDVMPDMYMPMVGRTWTSGATSEAVWAKGNHLVDLQAEVWQVDAFGNMTMQPTDPTASEMYLVNLGDVVQRHAGVSASYTFFVGSGWELSMDGRLELGSNRLNDTGSRSTYRAEYPALENLEPTQLSWLAGLRTEKELSDVVAIGGRLSRGTRLPDHLERYGYYIYQPLDGYFYIGNPGLEPELSSQAELYTVFGSGRSAISGRVAVWVNRMENYVAGERFDDLFKRYDNMGIATLWGSEAEMSIEMSRNWSLSGSLSWILGYHSELDEPLPMIPPLRGSASLNRNFEGADLEMRVRWSATQERVADRNHLEERTPGHTVLDLFGRVNLSSALRLQLGVENLFNTHFADHLSVNAFPEPGRNLQVSLIWRI